MSKKKISYKEKRLRRKAKKVAYLEKLKNSEEERAKAAYKLGLNVIQQKFEKGKGRSRHAGKAEGDNHLYITSVKSYRDTKGTIRRFSQFVAKYSDGTDLANLENLIDYADAYIIDCEKRGLSAWTLATYKSHLGKIFDLPITYFPQTPPRERKNIKRSRLETDNDRHISKEKRNFFSVVGSALGLRKQELISIKGTALFPERAKNGLHYFEIKGKGGFVRVSPIMAKSAEEEAMIIDFFRKAGNNYVFSGKNGTHRVPTKLDEHEYRAEYANRVYIRYERDLDMLPRHEKTYLRKELKGHVLDKYAELKASKALGHRRIDEFRKSYVYKLLE